MLSHRTEVTQLHQTGDPDVAQPPPDLQQHSSQGPSGLPWLPPPWSCKHPPISPPPPSPDPPARCWGGRGSPVSLESSRLLIGILFREQRRKLDNVLGPAATYTWPGKGLRFGSLPVKRGWSQWTPKFSLSSCTHSFLALVFSWVECTGGTFRSLGSSQGKGVWTSSRQDYSGCGTLCLSLLAPGCAYWAWWEEGGGCGSPGQATWGWGFDQRSVGCPQGRQTAPITGCFSLFYPAPSLSPNLSRSRPSYPIPDVKRTCQSLLWDRSFPCLRAGTLVGCCLLVWSL